MNTAVQDHIVQDLMRDMCQEFGGYAVLMALRTDLLRILDEETSEEGLEDKLGKLIVTQICDGLAVIADTFDRLATLGEEYDLKVEVSNE